MSAPFECGRAEERDPYNVLASAKRPGALVLYSHQPLALLITTACSPSVVLRRPPRRVLKQFT